MTDTRLTKTIQVRFEADDHFELTGEAGAAGVSVSSFARDIVLKDLEGSPNGAQSGFTPDTIYFEYLARVMSYIIMDGIENFGAYNRHIDDLTAELQKHLGVT